MPPKKKNNSVIAVCIQEPQEDGSSMDFGMIEGDNLRFLHQAFITDTIIAAASNENVDIRLYYIGLPERKKLVKIVTDYLAKIEKGSNFLKKRFELVEMDKERWGVRVERIFDDCFKAGYDDVLIVGSRTPTINPERFSLALKLLKESDAVFGPTPEGRYYMIGMSGSAKVHLSEYDWKSPSIYSDVSQAFTDNDLAWSELEIWYCVETSEELEMAIRDLNQFRFEGDEITAMETEKVLERIIAKLES